MEDKKEGRFIPEYAFGEHTSGPVKGKKYLKKTAFEESIKAEQVKCVCCSKDIKPAMEDEDYMGECGKCGHNEPTDVDHIMLKDSIASTISAGYGSDYDGFLFVIAICDDCIEKKLKEGNIVYKGRYM